MLQCFEGGNVVMLLIQVYPMVINHLPSVDHVKHGDKTCILHSLPTCSVTAAAELFCSLASVGLNAMHWKVVPFQVEFVLGSRSPVY